jgi:predicted phosphodiesterase
MERGELVINSKGTTEIVPNSNRTIISKPEHRLGTTFSQYEDIARRRAKEVQEASLWKDEVKININTPHEWFGIQPWGDFHIGSHGCDYDKLDELLAGVMTHDNLKTITLGNLGDFFVPLGGPKDGILGDVLTPQTQMFTIKKFLTEQQDNILASVNEPDHADWVYRASGIDVYEFLGQELNIPLVTAGGSVKINFGNVEYDIMPFHKIAKFKSAFNLTHGHKRALELHRDADVVLAGHTHKPDYEWAFRNGHDISLIQIGTLETKETGNMYGKKEGFLGPVRSVYPILLLNTLRKDMQIVTDLSHAEPFLRT